MAKIPPGSALANQLPCVPIPPLSRLLAGHLPYPAEAAANVDEWEALWFRVQRLSENLEHFVTDAHQERIYAFIALEGEPGLACNANDLIECEHDVLFSDSQLSTEAVVQYIGECFKCKRQIDPDDEHDSVRVRATLRFVCRDCADETKREESSCHAGDE